MGKGIDNKLYDAATDWLARLHAEDQPDWTDPQLIRWLEQSEDHRLAFAEVSGDWFAVEELSLELDAAEPESGLVGGARSWRIPAWMGAVAAFAIFAVLMAPLGRSLMQQLRHDFHAGQGQVLSRTMADGSVITLGGGTSIDIEFLPGRRLVRLHGGEAYFDVAADSDRPFLVQFAGGEVRVLGTRFGIISTPDSDSALVGVLHGRVEAGMADSDQRRVLTERQLVTVSPEGITTDGRQPSELFAWTTGQLVFRQQSLAHIVERMDRYMPGRIVLLGEPGNQRRFSLVVSLSNAPQALDTLADQAGLRQMTLPGVTLLY